MLEREKTLLITVDFQQKLLPSIADADAMLLRTARLIQGARLLELPILVTEQYPRGVGSTDPRVVTALGQHYRPIEKDTMSCLREPAFKEALSATGRQQVLLCGIEAHVCVHQTAMDLRAEGFEVHWISDCVSSRRAADAERARERAAQEGCRISTHEMAIFELLRVSGTPVFKEWIRVVR